MDSLPTELLFVIIDLVALDQYSLAACNRLNKHWHRLTRHLLYKEPKLYRHSSLEAFLRTVDTPAITQYLSQTGSSTYHRECLKTAACTELEIPVGALVQTIDLSMLPHRWETVHVGHIQTLVQGCPYISTLNLNGCLLLRDNAVQIIAEQLGPRELRSLVLSACNKISDLAVLSICAHAVQVENLELSGCDRLSDISVLELGSATVAWALYDRQRSRWAQETQSQDNDNDSKENGTTVRGDRVRQSPPVGISKSIKSLDLSHCSRITDTGVVGLQRGATQLSSLNLEGCFGVLMSNVDNEWEDLSSEGNDEYMDNDLDDVSIYNEYH
ncbi:hypothetical protein EDD21DRAFT_380853 [Dissophora ornata]|nr:hypothetical protein EDD21DRAFT_380853 [Dissophora ornata]